MLERLEQDIKSAMLAGEKERAHALSFLRSTLLTIQKDSGTMLSEEKIIELMRKEIKKRFEAAELFDRGGNHESADKERYEAELINSYLPAQMSEQEIEAVMSELIKSSQLEMIQKNMGQLIGLTKAKLGSGADGGLIAKVAARLLSGE